MFARDPQGKGAMVIGDQGNKLYLNMLSDAWNNIMGTRESFQTAQEFNTKRPH